MVLGIGTDIVDVKRMEKAILNQTFLNKAFTESERERIKKAETAAGIFAAKEAFVKALGTGFSGVRIKDIEIVKDELGKPYFVLYNRAKSFMDEKNAKAFLSISHEKEYAIAFVIIEGDGVK